MTLPLVLLAIPSVIIGYLAIRTMLYGGFFDGVIFVAKEHEAMEKLAEEFHGAAAMGLHAFTSLPFALALAGVVTSWYFYLVNPAIPAMIREKFSGVYKVLDNKYYMDRINDIVFAAGARRTGVALWKLGDMKVIDGIFVNGSARLIGWFASVVRYFQSGYIYHYAFAMIIGVLALMSYFVMLHVPI